MNDKKRRLKAIEIDLGEMYEDLFGAKYQPGLQTTDKSEFNSIIETFRERVFVIREMQDLRDKRQAKRGYERTTDNIRANQEIREDIKRCQGILKEAVKRRKSNLKGKSEEVAAKLMANREKTLKNCFQLLRDVEQCEQGGGYQPPEPKQSLQDLKQKLVQEISDDDGIDLSDEQNFDRYRRKDMQIDEGLEEVIQENRIIQEGLKQANTNIDATGELIKQNLLRAEKIDKKLQKGTKDLTQLLLHYRKPNKLCMDVTLVLLLLALIGVVINMVKDGL